MGFENDGVYLKCSNNNVFLERSWDRQFVKHLAIYDIIGYKNFGGNRERNDRY